MRRRAGRAATGRRRARGVPRRRPGRGSSSTAAEALLTAGPVDGVGLDVGSTTVKAVAVAGGRVVSVAYRRHRGRPLDEARAVLATAEAALGGRGRRMVTGSAGGALAGALDATYVHEVHAVVAAVRRAHPRARTVVELGGQDAKMVHLDGAGGFLSDMNERCAAGTGATLDRALHRLGLDETALAALAVDDAPPLAVSAKCGVFAETDVVNHVKAGLPRDAVLVALLDAVVRGNLAVLAHGRPLPPQVVLLGGPHAFVPALATLWRRHLAARWRARAVPHGDDDDVIVPPDAATYAALGALVAAHEIDRVGPRALPRRGHAALPQAGGAPSRGRTLPGLVADGEDLDGTLAATAVPAPAPRRAPGPLALGIDAGSTTIKAVVTDASGVPVARAYRRSAASPITDAASLLVEIEAALGARADDVCALGVTGYGADLLGPVLGADATPVETLAHARAARAFVPDADVVCDVGGQDIKVLLLDGAGAVRRFHLSNQCAAGNGALLDATAAELGIRLERYADVAFTARRAPVFTVGCAVFLDTERITCQRDGFTPAEVLAGMAAVLPRNVWENVVAAPSLVELGRTFVLSGGVQRNRAAVKAQLDYLRARHPTVSVRVHPFPGEAGAIGAALAALAAVDRSDAFDAPASRPVPVAAAPSRDDAFDARAPHATRFVGFARATRTRFVVRNDETTRCRLCPSACARSFVRADEPGAPEHVTGHGCERGETVTRRPVRRAGHDAPASNPSRARNLLRIEAARLFGQVRPVAPVSTAGRALRIALPRVLAMYRSAPLFLHYLEAIGVPRDAIVLSEPTSEALWRRAAGRGTVDACFPAKVVQAHVADLLARRDERPFDVLFYPALTHAATAVTGTADTTACPVVAGTSLVTRAAFGADPDGRLPDGTLLLTPTLTLTNLMQLRHELFAAMQRIAPALTEAEHVAALDVGRAAQQAFEADLERDGAAAMHAARATGRAAIVVLGRPYHADPGLHHDLGAELWALGRTTLSIRALPKTRDALVAAGADADALDLAALAPFVTNAGAGEKLAAARIVGAHPWLVAVEISSFKCGEDASIYGAIAELARGPGKPFLALHDLDETRPATTLRLRLRTLLDAVEKYERSLALPSVMRAAEAR